MTDLKERLETFYKKHCPAKIEEIPKLLMKYQGKEALMIERLEIKYKNKFPLSQQQSIHDDLVNNMTLFYTQHCPSEVADIPLVLARYKGKENELISTLENRYGANFISIKPHHSTNMSAAQIGTGGGGPVSPSTDIRNRLTRFYQQHCPEKITQVPMLLEKYLGKEAEMITSLQRKYNALFPPYIINQPKQSELERNLRLFYKRHCPSKVENVPKLLVKYKGSERNMIGFLEVKYKAKFPQTRLTVIFPSAPDVEFPADMSWFEANLTLFYHKHNPDKLRHVKKLLQMYKGREKEMVEILERKYNAWFPQI